jgi:hypothetical protein
VRPHGPTASGLVRPAPAVTGDGAAVARLASRDARWHVDDVGFVGIDRRDYGQATQVRDHFRPITCSGDWPG